MSKGLAIFLLVLLFMFLIVGGIVSSAVGIYNRMINSDGFMILFPYAVLANILQWCCLLLLKSSTIDKQMNFYSIASLTFGGIAAVLIIIGVFFL